MPSIKLLVYSFVALFFFTVFSVSVFIIPINGESPVFSRISFPDDPDLRISDLDIDRYQQNFSNIINLYPLDILATTRVSDGKFLNGSIWLYNPIDIKNHENYIQNNLTFSMNVYLDTQASDKEIAYSVIVRPNSNNSWTKTIIEYEPDISPISSISLPPLSQKIIEINNDYLGFFENGNRYIDLSLDLNKIGNPHKYWISFKTSMVSGDTTLYDYTSITGIPPALNIRDYDWDKPISISVGDKKIVKLPIVSNETYFGITSTFNITNPIPGLNISFEKNPIDIPQDGTIYADMIIQADSNIYNGTSPIKQKINITEAASGGFLRTQEQIITINILPSLSYLEVIGEKLRNNNITYIIPLMVTTGVIYWLSKKISKDTKYNEIRIKDLLTVDASVIAGVLIFLTVGSSDIFSGKEVIQQVGLLTASIVFPFSLAAIRTLIKGEVEAYGIRFMIAGFVYLMISVILIAFINT